MTTDEPNHLTTRAAQELTLRLQALVGRVEGIKTVILSRQWAQDSAALPMGVLYAPDEDLQYSQGTPGRLRVRRSVALRFVVAFQRPAGPVNAFEAATGRVKAAVEAIVGADPQLTTADGPLTFDLRVLNVRSGFDPSAGNTIVVVAVSLLAIIDHVEGDPTRPLSRPRAA